MRAAGPPFGGMLAAGIALRLLAGCHKSNAGQNAGENASIEAETGAPTEPSASAGPPRVVPARCRAVDPGLVVVSNASSADLELGDATEFAGGYAVGLLHRTARGLIAAVAFLGPEAKGPARLVDLGPTLGDAPPPRLALRAGDLVVAAYGVPGDHPSPNDNDKVRDVTLYGVDARGAASVLFSVPQQRDDSLAFDVAFAEASSPPAQNGVVVWDEASRAGHGVVRGAFLAFGDRAPAPRDISPPESDAELPRVVARGAGYVALWIARRPDPSAASDAAELEATGEVRSFGWLEATALDEHGIPAGPVRRLTPGSGHVSAYDARMLAGAAKPTLLVVARDEGEAVDGSGGELLRVRIVGDGVEPPVAFPNDGLGRGAPALVDGDRPWLVWVDPHEQLRLMPLDETGAPSGAPSAEDEMAEARPLLFLRGPNAGSRHVLVASPLDVAAQLRAYTCGR